MDIPKPFVTKIQESNSLENINIILTVTAFSENVSDSISEHLIFKISWGSCRKIP